MRIVRPENAVCLNLFSMGAEPKLLEDQPFLLEETVNDDLGHPTTSDNANVKTGFGSEKQHKSAASSQLDFRFLPRDPNNLKHEAPSANNSCSISRRKSSAVPRDDIL